MKGTIIICLLLALHHMHCIADDARYDKNVNLFSSSGELLQVKYARNAGLRGAPVLCSQSVDNDIILCLPTPAAVQALQDRRSIDKVAKIGDGLWLAFSGLAGDGRALTRAARQFCLDYASKFGSNPSVRSVARYIGEIQHESTLTGGKRPFGVQVILIGEDEADGKLTVYNSDPSGEISNWKALAIGQNSVQHMKLLESEWRPTLNRKEVTNLLIRAARIRAQETNERGNVSDEGEDIACDVQSDTSSEAVKVDLYRFSVDKKTRRKSMTYYSSPDEMEASMES